MRSIELKGLVAATHTPFNADSSLNLSIVEQQAEHLLRQRIPAVFICGSTGESHSLTLQERRALAQRWFEVAKDTSLKVIVHVGSNCLADAQDLAEQAQALGAPAIAALAPCYFKPRTLNDLVQWCGAIAAAAPGTPFYFYDIPALTGVKFSMKAFLEQAADRVPTLRGIKYTNMDLVDYAQCLAVDSGAFDIPWGVDEAMLPALAAGARGAVGSTYNFAAPVYHRLLDAFQRGDLDTARQCQQRSVRLVDVLAGFGYLGAAKALMTMLGVNVGPARLPNGNPTSEQLHLLRNKLERLGFFEWITAAPASQES